MPCARLHQWLTLVLPAEVHRGEEFALGQGEKSNEVQTQKQREADKFRYHQANAQNQLNPVRELDEFYCKDEKVPKIDLETFAKGHSKEKEGLKFEQDMKQLQHELNGLEEGKCSLSTNLVLRRATRPKTISRWRVQGKFREIEEIKIAPLSKMRPGQRAAEAAHERGTH